MNFWDLNHSVVCSVLPLFGTCMNMQVQQLCCFVSALFSAVSGKWFIKWFYGYFSHADVTVIHHLEKAKNYNVLISLTYLFSCGKVFIPRACQSIASRFFWGSSWGVVVSCLYCGVFIQGFWFSHVLEGFSKDLILLFLFMDFIFKKMKSSLVWAESQFRRKLRQKQHHRTGSDRAF